jgi:uncharacterized protein YraI
MGSLNKTSAIIIAFMLHHQSADAASFNCSKAGSGYEKTICKNPNLSALDDNMAKLYSEAIKSSGIPDQIKKSQLNWIKGASNCATDTVCIERAYQSRIGELATTKPAQPVVSTQQMATVTAHGDGFLALRSDPSARVGSRLTTIPDGTTIALSQCVDKGAEGEWCKTTYSGKEGWIASKFVARSDSNKQEAKATQPQAVSTSLPQQTLTVIPTNNQIQSSANSSPASPQGVVATPVQPSPTSTGNSISTPPPITPPTAEISTVKDSQPQVANNPTAPPVPASAAKASEAPIIPPTQNAGSSFQAEQPEVANNNRPIQTIPEAKSNTASTTNSGQANEASQVKTTSGDGKDISTVLATGYGKDVPSAAQNAAKNALSQVVGSFMDASQMLQKQVKIENGLREVSSHISTDIKEYSQGSISKFEIIEAKADGGLTQVSARVGVKIEDFRHYITELAKDEISVDGASLFAKASENKKQKQEKASLLLDKVLLPVFMGKAEALSISSPLPYRDQVLNKSLNLDRRKSTIIHTMIKPERLDDTYLIPVNIKLKKDFLDEAKAVLDNISSGKSDIPGCPTRDSYEKFNHAVHQVDGTNDYSISILAGEFKSCEKTTFTTYTIEGVRDKIREGLERNGFVYGKYIIDYPERSVYFSFNNNAGESIGVYLDGKRVYARSDGFNFSIKCDPLRVHQDCIYIDIMGQFDGTLHRFLTDDMNRPYLAASTERNTIITTSRSFYSVIEPDINILSKTAKIEAKIH